MIDKDKPAIQRERISEAVREVLSGCEAVFDEKALQDFVRFRINHQPTGQIVGGPASERASVFANYSDEHLKAFITHLAPCYVKA